MTVDPTHDSGALSELLAPYGLVDKLVITVWAAYSVATVLLWADMVDPGRYMVLNFALLVGGLVLPRATEPLGPLAVDLGRVLMVGLTFFASYEWVAMVIDTIGPQTYELWALKADQLIFGGNPSEWMQAVHHPALSEYFQTVYLLYFPVLAAVAVALVAKRDRGEFNAYAVTLFTAVIFNQLMYIVVPIQSPFLIADTAPYSAYIHYETELYGLWNFDALRAHLLSATTMRHDCFPSGHTLHSLLAIYFAFKVHRAFGVIIAVLGLSIVASTLYLRYHYGIDLLVSATVALIWIPAVRAFLDSHGDRSDATSPLTSSRLARS